MFWVFISTCTTCSSVYIHVPPIPVCTYMYHLFQCVHTCTTYSSMYIHVPPIPVCTYMYHLFQCVHTCTTYSSVYIHVPPIPVCTYMYRLFQCVHVPSTHPICSFKSFLTIQRQQNSVHIFLYENTAKKSAMSFLTSNITR